MDASSAEPNHFKTGELLPLAKCFYIFLLDGFYIAHTSVIIFF